MRRFDRDCDRHRNDRFHGGDTCRDRRCDRWRGNWLANDCRRKIVEIELRLAAVDGRLRFVAGHDIVGQHFLARGGAFTSTATTTTPTATTATATAAGFLRTVVSSVIGRMFETIRIDRGVQRFQRRFGAVDVRRDARHHGRDGWRDCRCFHYGGGLRLWRFGGALFATRRLLTLCVLITFCIRRFRLLLPRLLRLLPIGLLWALLRLFGLLLTRLARFVLRLRFRLLWLRGLRRGAARFVSTRFVSTRLVTARFVATLLVAPALRAALLIATRSAVAVRTFATVAILLLTVLRTRRCVRRWGIAAAENALQPTHETAGFGGWGGLLRERGRRCGRRGLRLRLRRGGARGFLAVLAQRRRARRLDVGHCGRGRDVQIRLGQRDRRQLARGAALIARLCGLFAQLIVADTGDFVVGCMQRFVGNDHDRRVVALLDLVQRAALFVEQIVRNLDRNLHQHLAGVVFHRMLFGEADDRQRQRFDAAHAAVAIAARADKLAGFAEARAQPLARHFHQAELGDAAQLDAGAVVLQRLRELVFDIALVLVRCHVDEVDHHQTTKIAQTHLPRDFFGRFQVGVERSFLDVASLGGARGVHVDRGQRFGLVDHQRAAGGQAHRALVGVLDLRFDLEAVEQRRVVDVLLELPHVLRHDLLDELFRLLIHLGRIDQDLADVGAHVVAQRADDQPRLLIDQERRSLLERRFGNRLPHAEQVIEIPLQLFSVAADTSGADDHAHFVGDGQYVHRGLQRGAVVAFNPARDAAGSGRVGHQHHVPAGQRDERGQGGALVAAFFLVDLDNDFLTLAQQFLDPGLVVIYAGLEIVAGDFLQRQEAVALAAVLDERSFERRFQPGDPAFINIGFFLLFRRPFDIDVVEILAFDDGDAQFFSLRRIDQHAFHGLAFLTRINPARERARGTPWAFSPLETAGSTVARSSRPRGRSCHGAGARHEPLQVFQRCNTTASRGSACCSINVLQAGRQRRLRWGAR